MSRRTIELPEAYRTRIAEILADLGYSLDKPGRLAECVRRLSDFYTQHGDLSTPWREPWAQVANLCYYFPLNYARNRAVATEALRLGFFRDLRSVVDCGSGLGSALFSVLEFMEPQTSALALDLSSDALNIGSRLGSHFQYSRQTEQPRSFASQLVLASYLLTELAEPPKEWLSAEALMIVEPGTEQDGRSLERYREHLIAEGFHIWAPCTHQAACPLLSHSQHDWCHDRVHWQQPAWWMDLEKLLPMKNRTIAFSYLLARKSLPPPAKLASFARLTGDALIEKGKTRQSVCRGPEREFLAWFPQRLRKQIAMERGSLVELLEQVGKKSNEVRLMDREDAQPVRELAADEAIG